MAGLYILTSVFCLSTAFSPVVIYADDKHDDDDKYKAPPCMDCGVVNSVQTVEKAGEASGLGAAAGALAGGLIGNKVGDGGTAATVAGVAGGALTAHYAEKAMTGGSKEWKVTVQMKNGETRTVMLKTEPSVKSGDQVRVSDGNVVAYKETPKKSKDHDDDDKHDHHD